MVEFTPCPIFCPLSLLLVRAIQDQAFHSDHNIETLDDLMTRPKLLPGSNQIPLKWKPEMKDQQVFRMCYDTYRSHFQKILLAAGYRDRLRLYAIRVGTGNTLDGTSPFHY